MKRRESREEGGVAEWVTVMKMKDREWVKKNFLQGRAETEGSEEGPE
jgi:hypothetical protein